MDCITFFVVQWWCSLWNLFFYSKIIEPWQWKSVQGQTASVSTGWWGWIPYDKKGYDQGPWILKSRGTKSLLNNAPNYLVGCIIQKRNIVKIHWDILKILWYILPNVNVVVALSLDLGWWNCILSHRDESDKTNIFSGSQFQNGHEEDSGLI